MSEDKQYRKNEILEYADKLISNKKSYLLKLENLLQMKLYQDIEKGLNKYKLSNKEIQEIVEEFEKKYDFDDPVVGGILGLF